MIRVMRRYPGSRLTQISKWRETELRMREPHDEAASKAAKTSATVMRLSHATRIFVVCEPD